AQPGGDQRPELAAPAPDRLGGHDDPSLAHQLLHTAVAQGEAVVEADTMRDDLRRGAVSAVGRDLHVHEQLLSAAHILPGLQRKLTVPTCGRSRTVGSAVLAKL